MNYEWKSVIKNASKGASSAKRRAELEKIGQTFQKMQDYNDRVADDYAQTMKRKEVNKELMPILSDYYKNARNLPVDQREKIVDYIVDVSNKRLGTQYKRFSIDHDDPSKVALIDMASGNPLLYDLNEVKELAPYRMEREREAIKEAVKIKSDQELANKNKSLSEIKDVNNKKKP